MQSSVQDYTFAWLESLPMLMLPVSLGWPPPSGNITVSFKITCHFLLCDFFPGKGMHLQTDPKRVQVHHIHISNNGYLVFARRWLIALTGTYFSTCVSMLVR